MNDIDDTKKGCSVGGGRADATTHGVIDNENKIFDLAGTTNKISFKFNRDDRCFKSGDEICIEAIKGTPTYIVGPNGCGKTTLMHYIRAKKNSLFDVNKELFDGMTNNDDAIYKNTTVVDVSGIDVYDYVFVLDSIDDDPTSFINAATAAGFVAGGGFVSGRISKGQKAKDMLGRFIDKIQKTTNFSTNEFKEKKRAYDKRVLIVVDEVDEGFDISAQFKFHRLLTNIAVVFNADVLCICHNPICVFGSPLKDNTIVYDLGDRKKKTISKYISEQTGYEIKVNKVEKDLEV